MLQARAKLQSQALACAPSGPGFLQHRKDGRILLAASPVDLFWDWESWPRFAGSPVPLSIREVMVGKEAKSTLLSKALRSAFCNVIYPFGMPDFELF